MPMALRWNAQAAFCGRRFARKKCERPTLSSATASGGIRNTHRMKYSVRVGLVVWSPIIAGFVSSGDCSVPYAISPQCKATTSFLARREDEDALNTSDRQRASSTNPWWRSIGSDHAMGSEPR